MPRKQAFPQAQSRRVFGHPFRVGLYARVSTHDQQTLPLQIRILREYAAKRGWSIVAQIKEVGSGTAQRELRTTLIAAARRREVDVVLVWRLDRWGRSVADLVSTLQELQHLGVGFVSLTEALDLTTPAGRAMAGLLAVFAEFEREILRERVRAGLAHARLNGKRLGRPPSVVHNAIETRKLYRQGITKSEIARRLQISRTSVRRLLNQEKSCFRRPYAALPEGHDKHVSTAGKEQSSIVKKRVTPHVLRHSCAMHILQATGDIRKVSLWLGHASIQSTEIYLRADPTEKLDALAMGIPPALKRGKFQVPDKLLAMFKEVGKGG